MTVLGAQEPQEPYMFFGCPSVTDFWNRSTEILDELLGPHPPQKKRIHPRYHSPATPKLPAGSDEQTAPTATHQTTMRLQYRLYIEMHYSL
jgi:hypothetical protein